MRMDAARNEIILVNLKMTLISLCLMVCVVSAQFPQPLGSSQACSSFIRRVTGSSHAQLHIMLIPFQFAAPSTILCLQLSS